jgi:hypothetical protein
LSTIEAAVLLGWVAIALLALAVAGVLTQLRQIQTLMLGGATVAARSVIGREIASIGSAQARTLVLLASPDCSSCTPAIEAFLATADAEGQPLRRVFSYRRANHWPNDDRIVVDREGYTKLESPWVPALFLLDRTGTVVAAQPIADLRNLSHQLETMMARAETAWTSA